MTRRLGILPLCWLLFACDVASVREAPSAIARNECQSPADCGGGACVDFQCRGRTTDATLQRLLFEVTAPANGSPIGGVQFLIPKDLSKEDASLVLGPISHVAGRVTAEGRACELKFVANDKTLLKADDSSVPARVSLIPTSSALGLYSPRAVVQSDTIDMARWGFSATISPGNYDIYVEPRPQPDQSCPVPPQLFLGQAILAGTLPLTIGLTEPSVFEFHVVSDAQLSGWTVDMLDPVSGRVISNRVPLALVPKSTTEYVTTVSYSRVVVGGEANAQQDQLLRISPPDGLPRDQPMPTVLLARSALGLFSAGRGTFTELTSLPTAVHVHGQVTRSETPSPASATVTLAATKITGINPGVLASFVRTLSVDADGQFDVYLLPGTYRVSTVPLSSLEPSPDNEFPVTADTREWLVPSMPLEQAGKVIALNNAVPVSGRVVGASGAPVANAQVQAVASPLSIQSDVLQEALLGPPFVPRASAAAASGDGNFSLNTDPGTFDITVRPNANTGFAWLVMPGVALSGVGRGLKQISMPLPIAYRGTVNTPRAEGADVVPGALIRAYMYLQGGDQYTPDVSKADSVLQVAETRADEEGVFEILIPAELNRPPSE
jgi:hypothetical protein